MFNFRLLNMGNGTQIIDTTLKTPYEALTPLQMIEYIEVDNQLSYMDRIKRREKREAERKRKLAKNPLWKLACMCGMV